MISRRTLYILFYKRANYSGFSLSRQAIAVDYSGIATNNPPRHAKMIASTITIDLNLSKADVPIVFFIVPSHPFLPMNLFLFDSAYLFLV
jgi:hypothetical protein